MTNNTERLLVNKFDPRMEIGNSFSQIQGSESEYCVRKSLSEYWKGGVYDESNQWCKQYSKDDLQLSCWDMIQFCLIANQRGDH